MYMYVVYIYMYTYIYIYTLYEKNIPNGYDWYD